MSAARNFGISQSIGEYIIFIDACKRSEKNSEKFDLYGKQLDYGKYSNNSTLNSNDIMYLIFNYRIQGYPFGYISKRSLWNTDSFDTKISIAEDLLALVQIIIKNKNLRIHIKHINKYGKYRYSVKRE